MIAFSFTGPTHCKSKHNTKHALQQEPRNMLQEKHISRFVVYYYLAKIPGFSVAAFSLMIWALVNKIKQPLSLRRRSLIIIQQLATIARSRPRDRHQESSYLSWTNTSTFPSCLMMPAIRAHLPIDNPAEVAWWPEKTYAISWCCCGGAISLEFRFYGLEKAPFMS